MKPSVLAAISGGVDSAVSALLLKDKYKVTGIFMRNWELESCSENDFQDAKRACQVLGIELREKSFQKEYWNQVFQPSLELMQQGATPNPDVLCNREIKFSSLLNYSIDKGFDFLATGHYAQIREQFLMRALDQRKDQTYFLSQVLKSAFSRVMFPVGSLHKTQVKQIATENGLDFLAKKKESMGLCFIGKQNFKSFLGEFVDQDPGNFINQDGNIVGEHRGLAFYTIGQNASIGGLSCKYFVKNKLLDSNEIIVSRERAEIKARAVDLINFNWIKKPSEEKIEFKMYSNQKHFSAGKLLDSTLTFDEPQTAISVGQFAVFYQGEYCLGSAQIAKVS